MKSFSGLRTGRIPYSLVTRKSYFSCFPTQQHYSFSAIPRQSRHLWQHPLCREPQPKFASPPPLKLYTHHLVVFLIVVWLCFFSFFSHWVLSCVVIFGQYQHLHHRIRQCWHLSSALNNSNISLCDVANCFVCLFFFIFRCHWVQEVLVPVLE